MGKFGGVVKQIVEKLATNPDTSSTWVGGVLSSVLAAKIDYDKLLGGDPVEVANVVGVVAVWLVCWLIGKKHQKGS